MRITAALAGAASLVLLTACGDADPGSGSEAAQTETTATVSPDASEAETASAPSEDAENVRYVVVETAEERDAPSGKVVNRIYRGQRVEVTDRRDGWARVTGLQYDPRWVRESQLGRQRLPDLPQPKLEAALDDSRIQGVPKVGESGAREADVLALRTAAAELLSSGECQAIEFGDKSVNRPGVYYLNCGESTNRFFKMAQGKPQFCGTNASSC